jgi:hypothetical protein
MHACKQLHTDTMLKRMLAGNIDQQQQVHKPTTTGDHEFCRSLLAMLSAGSRVIE